MPYAWQKSKIVKLYRKTTSLTVECGGMASGGVWSKTWPTSARHILVSFLDTSSPPLSNVQANVSRMAEPSGAGRAGIRKYVVHFRGKGPEVVRKLSCAEFTSVGAVREQFRENENTSDLVPQGASYAFGFLLKRRGRPKYYVCHDDDLPAMYEEYKTAKMSPCGATPVMLRVHVRKDRPELWHAKVSRILERHQRT